MIGCCKQNKKDVRAKLQPVLTNIKDIGSLNPEKLQIIFITERQYKPPKLERWNNTSVVTNLESFSSKIHNSNFFRNDPSKFVTVTVIIGHIIWALLVATPLSTPTLIDILLIFFKKQLFRTKFPNESLARTHTWWHTWKYLFYVYQVRHLESWWFPNFRGLLKCDIWGVYFFLRLPKTYMLWCIEVLPNVLKPESYIVWRLNSFLPIRIIWSLSWKHLHCLWSRKSLIWAERRGHSY